LVTPFAIVSASRALDLKAVVVFDHFPRLLKSVEFIHHDLPPRTRRSRGVSAFSLSRSAQRPSILVSMRSSNASADAVEMPAR
jgi:hypothetical protein